jgi:hypothetical protein
VVVHTCPSGGPSPSPLTKIRSLGMMLLMMMLLLMMMMMMMMGRYSEGLYNTIKWMLTRDPKRRPRVETLETLTPLAPYLREAKAVALEHDLHNRYQLRCG